MRCLNYKWRHLPADNAPLIIAKLAAAIDGSLGVLPPEAPELFDDDLRGLFSDHGNRGQLLRNGCVQ
jgi:hypothetical protein